MNRTLAFFLHLVLLALASAALAQERLICRLSDPNLAANVASSYGLQLLDETAPAPFALYECPPGTTADFFQTAMLGDPRVVWAEDDGTLEPPEKQSSKGSVGNVIADWGYLASENANFLNQINWKGPRADGYRPVRVAVLDTGLSPQVPRLWNRVVASINAVPDAYGVEDLPRNVDSNGNGEPDDGAGHGTMVVGLIDLIAPHVDLVLARVADSDGVATSWSVIKGLAFAAIQGAEIANVSLGAIDRLNALSDVLDWTDEVGLVVVAPAGNGSTGEVLFPAGYSKTICVTGVDANDVKAPFSNWGGDADLAAPAVGIRSAWWNGMTAVWSGTSFAAPMVTASIADTLRRTARPIAPSVLRNDAKRGGDDIDALNPNYDGELGRRLNVRWMEYAVNKYGRK